MKKQSLFYLVFALLLVSCGNNSLTEKVINTYENGQPSKVYFFDKEGQLVVEKDYYDTGALMMEGPMANGVRNGKWTSYFPDGKVQSTGVFKDGISVGKTQVYYENGNLWMDGFYKDDDHRCGEWVFYDEQGYEMERVDYGPCD
jgi:antitoxin component YwqK of YwqJK toxin-antitoxin module